MEKVKYWMVETQNDHTWPMIHGTLGVEGTLQTNALDIFSAVRRQEIDFPIPLQVDP